MKKGNSVYSAERAERGGVAKALRILKRASVDQPPLAGDELPIDIPESLDVQLRFAIAHKRLIQLTYGGHVRALEPHDYGVQKGMLRLLAFQIRGGSSHAKGGKYGWKLLSLSRIEACTVLDDRFPGSRARSTQEHLVWDQLFARVE